MSVAAALSIASIIGPKLIGAITGSDKGEQVAEQVFDVAKQVTGTSSVDSALVQLNGNSDVASRFKQELAKHEASLLKEAYKDRGQAREVYLHKNETADFISKQIMSRNLGFVVVLVLVNAIAVYFLKNEAAVLATVSNILGIVIKSLLDERKDVTGFYLGGSLDGRAANDAAKGVK